MTSGVDFLLYAAFCRERMQTVLLGRDAGTSQRLHSAFRIAVTQPFSHWWVQTLMLGDCGSAGQSCTHSNTAKTFIIVDEVA